MLDIEKMRAYIQRTKISNKEKYDMRVNEAKAVYTLYQTDAFEAIALAFQFGMAKGYRAACGTHRGEHD